MPSSSTLFPAFPAFRACHGLRTFRSLGLAAALALASQSALAQAPAPSANFEPQVGQAGKDVIWVPTPPELIETMLRAANVGPNDLVVDLGSGDGRIAIAAAKDFGARARGIEFNPDMAALATRNAEKAGVASRVQFIRGDIFEQDFRDATVVSMYLLTSLNMKLRPKLLEMKPGTRIVSNSFDLGDWAPDQNLNAGGRLGYYWVVPAKVAGNWRADLRGAGISEAVELRLGQAYQKLDGRLMQGAAATALEGGLRGEQITLRLAQPVGGVREFTGTVNGDRIEGTARNASGAAVSWSATRR